MTQHFIALLTAIILDVLFGELPDRFHPVAWMGKYLAWVSGRLNRGSSIPQFFMGGVILLLGGLIFAIPVRFFAVSISVLPDWMQGVLLGLLLKPVFAFRGLIKAGKSVQQFLIANDLDEARRLTAWSLVSRDTSRLSAPQVASAVIESLTENITDSLFAPLFFFALGGLPAVWVYRFVNTADAMIGYRTPQFEYFGKCAARIDDLLNWIPARLAAGVLVIAAVFRRLDAKAAWRVMLDQHKFTASPNAGWTMSAAAGALQILLEKPGYYTLGQANRLPEAHDIERAIGLVQAASALCVLICLGIVMGVEFLF